MTAAAAPVPLDGRDRRGVVATIDRHPVGLVWFGTVLFSTGPVLVAGASISGVVFSFWRLWCGVAILGAAAALRRLRVAEATTARGWAWAAACGVAFAVHQLMFMSALRITSVVDATLMNTIAPVVVGLLAVPAFGERPGTRFRLWSVLAMAGAAAVALAGSTGPEGDPVGMALAAGNVVFYALYFVGSKMAVPHISTVPFLFGNIVAAALTVSAFVALTGEAATPIDGGDLLRCAAVALLPGAVGHFSITRSLATVPANLPPVVMLTIPVLSGAMAWVLLGQEVRPAQIVAGAVTLVAVAGAVRTPSAQAVGADEALVLAEET